MIIDNHMLPINKAWQNWKNALEGNDINSVFRQIISMIWDTAIFKIIYEGQKAKFQSNPNNPKVNQSYYNFILRNYLHTQTSNIRRITDSSYGIEGEKGTYSLRAIIKDIQKYQSELTRRDFFKLNQIPYDTSKIKQERILFFRNHSSDETAFIIPRELDLTRIEEKHEVFDKLSNTIPEQRSTTDIIENRVFDSLIEKLDSCGRISNYVNKFVAHSATPESRSLINQEHYQVSLRDIWNAHKIIFEVANFVSGTLFSIDQMALPIVHPTFFDYWDEPLFAKEDFAKIHNILNNYREETESWRNSSDMELWKVIQSDQN